MRIRVFMMPLFILDKNKGKQKKNNTKKEKVKRRKEILQILLF